jgi:subtilase family serine protease
MITGKSGLLSGKGLVLGAISATCLTLALSGPAAAGGNGSDIVYTANPPHKLLMAASRSAPHAFPSPSQCVAQFGFACYTPALMRAAYNVPAGADGAGQTIVIVDAYGSPTVQQDLDTFSAAFSLPIADFRVVYPMGKPTFNPQQNHDEANWAFETSLDVQWAHAVAPAAKIVLVIAPNNGGNALNNAQRYAINNHLGQVMSLSFGADEAAINGGGNNLQLNQAHQNYRVAAAAGITVFASSGDGGASDGHSVANASYPASDPLVTAVGGTDLFMTDAGAYTGETVWNDGDNCPFGCTSGPFGATGGAVSKIFAAPSYQSALSGIAQRSTSDIAYNAGVYTGVLVYVGFLGTANNGFYFVGGTSAGAPQWAAITALANQALGHPVGFFNPTLYAIGANSAKYAAAFHDVTIGDNAFKGPGFAAQTGYDLPTGLGSPNVTNLLTVLSGP